MANYPVIPESWAEYAHKARDIAGAIDDREEE